MARLWSSGIELNSLTSAVEFVVSQGSNDTIETALVRSGTYSYRAQFATNQGYLNAANFRASAQEDHVFVRMYFRVDTAVNAQIEILSVRGNLGAIAGQIRLNTNNTLELWDASSQIGSDSSALTDDTWYRIEMEVDTTTANGSNVLTARIDGVDFASATNLTIANINSVDLGGRDISDATSGSLYFDDIAINDSSGSFQNSWPGEGEIIHLRPNAAGDNAGWNDGTTDLYSSIDEVTPNDATDFIGSTDANAISDFNLDATPAALASDDTINCVQVGWRFNDSSSSFDHGVKLRIKASSSGTVEESAEQIIPDTTWRTNKIASPFNYHLTLYDLPGASTTGWTKADLDTAQIGAENSTDQLGNAQISTMWLLVDHKPAAGGAATVTHLLGSTGVGG